MIMFANGTPAPLGPGCAYDELETVVWIASILPLLDIWLLLQSLPPDSDNSAIAKGPCKV